MSVITEEDWLEESPIKIPGFNENQIFNSRATTTIIFFFLQLRRLKSSLYMQESDASGAKKNSKGAMERSATRA